MLVLSRNEGQRIVIGDDIVITVLGNDGGRVRLGIEAPRAVPIRRSELKVLTPSELRNPASGIAPIALCSKD